MGEGRGGCRVRLNRGSHAAAYKSFCALFGCLTWRRDDIRAPPGKYCEATRCLAFDDQISALRASVLLARYTGGKVIRVGFIMVIESTSYGVRFDEVFKRN